jgi:quercetin dioxygenase-like cupin family protein
MAAESRHFQLNVTEIDPAPVMRDDGWRDMDIRFLVGRETANAGEVCFWRTVFPPGAAHERHYHPHAAEVLYVLRGRGAAGTEDEEHEVVPGTAQYIPPGAVHWLRNLELDDELEIVGCYAPAGSLEDAGYVFVSEISEQYRQVD